MANITAKRFAVKSTVKVESSLKAEVPRVFDLPSISSLVSGIRHKDEIVKTQRTKLKCGVSTFFPRNHKVFNIILVRVVIAVLVSESIKLIARDNIS